MGKSLIKLFVNLLEFKSIYYPHSLYPYFNLRSPPRDLGYSAR